MHERIKKLRKALDLTQQEFGERIGIKRNTLANYEIGRNEPIDAVISLICREFNVSEAWLRNGVGEMFNQPQSRKDEIQHMVDRMLEGRKAEFKYRLVSVLNSLDDDQWESLENYLRQILGERPAEPDSKPAEQPLTIDEQVELYRQQLLSEKQRASQVSSVKESGVG